MTVKVTPGDQDVLVEIRSDDGKRRLKSGIFLISFSDLGVPRIHFKYSRKGNLQNEQESFRSMEAFYARLPAIGWHYPAFRKAAQDVWEGTIKERRDMLELHLKMIEGL